jgi:hypothetical protein
MQVNKTCITVLIPEVILRPYTKFKQRTYYKTLTTVAQFVILDLQNMFDTGCCGMLRYIRVENLIQFEKGGHTHRQSHTDTLMIS